MTAAFAWLSAYAYVHDLRLADEAAAPVLTAAGQILPRFLRE
jgi:hypothetical protein